MLCNAPEKQRAGVLVNVRDEVLLQEQFASLLLFPFAPFLCSDGPFNPARPSISTSSSTSWVSLAHLGTLKVPCTALLLSCRVVQQHHSELPACYDFNTVLSNDRRRMQAA